MGSRFFLCGVHGVLRAIGKLFSQNEKYAFKYHALYIFLVRGPLRGKIRESDQVACRLALLSVCGSFFLCRTQSSVLVISCVGPCRGGGTKQLPRLTKTRNSAKFMACQDYGKRSETSKKPGDVKAHQQIRHIDWELPGTAYSDPGTVYHHQRRGVGFAGSSPCECTLGFLPGKGARP